MEKTGMLLLAGIVVGLGLSAMGCGEDEESNPCRRYNGLKYEAYADACEKIANCCFCACFENVPNTVAGCTQNECASYNFAALLEDDPPCEGPAASEAEGCLANEDPCYSQLRGVVMSVECGVF